MEILGLVKMTRGMRKIPKEDYEKWIEDQNKQLVYFSVVLQLYQSLLDANHLLYM